MKIILFVSSMGSGGAERVAATLANAWSAEGHEVILMPTFSGCRACFYELSPAVRLVYLADLVKAHSGFRLCVYFRRVWRLRQFVLREAPDVLISFLTNVNIMVTLATRGLGIRILVCERTDPFHFPTPWPLRVLRTFIYPLASRLIVQTESVASQYRALWRPIPQIAVIGNPVPESFVAQPTWQHTGRRRKRLLSVGRLDENKGFDTLIRVFSPLLARHPDWVLRIVGEGPYRSALENSVALLGLSGHVEMPGRTDDIKGELLNAEAFVLASRYEGFPNALLEAMVVGVPSVTVDYPSGPKEISEAGKVAILVRPDDEKALIDALDRVMGDRQLRQHLSKVGRQSVLARFSLSSVLAKWQRVLVEK